MRNYLQARLELESLFPLLFCCNYEWYLIAYSLAIDSGRKCYRSFERNYSIQQHHCSFLEILIVSLCFCIYQTMKFPGAPNLRILLLRLGRNY